MNARDMELLLRLHQPAVYRYVRFLGIDAGGAEDFVQETFLRAFRAANAPGAADMESWRAWLRATARNLVIDDHRRRGAETAALGVDVARADALWLEVAGDGDGSEQVAALRECLQSLPERQRAAVMQRYAHGMGRDEMARHLGISPDGVKMLLRRVREALARCIEARLAREQVVRPTPVRP
jgi:RNA polymerase sigma-70 factor (ECF subfamily)